MGGLPVARRLRADSERHHQHFACIVPTAAHFHQIGVGSEITRAHLGVSLKTAGAKNNRTAAQFTFFVRIRYYDAFDPSVVAKQLPHARLVANFDSHSSGDLTPLAELSQTAANTAHRMNDQTGFKIVSAVDDNMAIDLPLDAQIPHPMDRRIGLLHQNVGESLVDPATGDPLKISMKLFSRVGR